MTNSTNNVAPTEVTGLTIQDLNLALQVIQVSSTRGAFKADELTMVGGLHDRIYKFLNDSGAFTKAPEAPAQVSDDTLKG